MISNVLPFGQSVVWRTERSQNAIGYREHHSPSHDAVICVYHEAGNVIETHEHKGDCKEW